jgi:hypothetical protein
MDFSIVIPYLSKSSCINLCKDILKENTKHSYELIEIIDSNDVYDAYNTGVAKASTNTVVLMNDDMFVSKNWDEYYIKHTKDKTICTGYLVEPGVIPVSNKNIMLDFGISPETFRKNEFQKWCDATSSVIPEFKENCKGWYMPISFNKDTFIPYPNTVKFPHPNDITLLDEILPMMGFKFLKVKSFVYHLQNYSRVLR